MQSQVLRYIRFFIFGCWGILLLLMLLYGPWMIQSKQITIPDISITNFMIRDTSSFFPMHQEAAEQLIGEGKAVLSATEAVPNKLPNMRLVVFLLLLFPLCTKVLRTRFSESLLVPHLSDIRGMLRASVIEGADPVRKDCGGYPAAFSPPCHLSSWQGRDACRESRIAPGVFSRTLLPVIRRRCLPHILQTESVYWRSHVRNIALAR